MVEKDQNSLFTLFYFFSLNSSYLNNLNFFFSRKIFFVFIKKKKILNNLIWPSQDLKNKVFKKTYKNSVDVKFYFNDANLSFNAYLFQKTNLFSINNYAYRPISVNENIFFYTFLNFFLALNFSNYSSIFKNSRFSRFFFFNNKAGKLRIVNSKKLLLRWLHSFDFLYNLNYFYLKPLIMSLPFFKKQCLALNWFFFKWDVLLWKFCFPFFLNKTNGYDFKIAYFYSKLKEDISVFCIVTDCMYHLKNLYYLRKNFFFTIGFVNLSGNPWVVNYPIVNMFESLSNQSFFFKIFSYSAKLASYDQFIFLKKNWYFFLKKNIIAGNF